MSSLIPTKHAQKRMQQRSMSAEDIEMILQHGEEVPGDGLLLSNHSADKLIRSLKQEITTIERLRNRKVVLNGSAVVTCYPCDQSEMRRMRRLAHGH